MHTSSLRFLTLLFVGVTLSACSPKFHETITDTRNGQTIGGYCTDCALSFDLFLNLNDTLYNKIYLEWKRKGIETIYRAAPEPSTISVEDSSYVTNLGVKTGDNLKKVRKLYGRPWKRKHIYVNLGEKNTYYFGSAYFYKGVTFYYDKHKYPRQVLTYSIYKYEHNPFRLKKP